MRISDWSSDVCSSDLHGETLGALLLLEALFPARILPRVRFWRLAGITAFGLFFFLSSYLPLLWSEWLVRFQLFDLTALPLWAGVLAGLLVYEAGVYAWHRSMHRSRVLWRGVHPMHQDRKSTRLNSSH